MTHWNRRFSIVLTSVVSVALPYFAAQAYFGRVFDVPKQTELSATTTAVAIASSTEPVKLAERAQAGAAFKPLDLRPAQNISETLSILNKIADCESEGNPLAKNPASSAKGLLQIIDGTWSAFACEGNVYNPEDNMNCGLKIATKSGFHHWNESRACWIKLI